jgi:probable selenium-dependent hydroxylase accessory protein YqeC
VERITRVTGLQEDEAITPRHFARLLASREGMLKSTDGRRVVPVINMVDDAAREALAREAASAALELTDCFDRVVLVCLTRPADVVVAVVRR